MNCVGVWNSPLVKLGVPPNYYQMLLGGYCILRRIIIDGLGMIPLAFVASVLELEVGRSGGNVRKISSNSSGECGGWTPPCISLFTLPFLPYLLRIVDAYPLTYLAMG